MGRLEKFFNRRRVWVTSHETSVGAAVVRRLWQERCDILLSTGGHPDLSSARDVQSWVRCKRPDVIFVTGAMPGGGVGRVPARLVAERNLLAAAEAGAVATVVSLEPAATLTPVALPRCRQVRFVTLVADRSSCGRQASGLLVLYRRMHEAACRFERELRIDGLDVSEILPLPDDIADAACFLAGSYSGAARVHLVPEDFGEFEDMAAEIAEAAGYEGQIEVRRLRAAAAVTTMRTLGWRSAVPLRDRIRSLCDTWPKHGAPTGVLN